jgi:hypothetical protein
MAIGGRTERQSQAILLPLEGPTSADWRLVVTEESVRCDQNGMLIERGVHDAVLEEMRYIRGVRCDLRLRDPLNQTRWLSLLGLRQLGLRDLVDGLTISEVFCWRLAADPIPPLAQREALRVLSGGAIGEEQSPGFLERLARQFGQEYLVHIESSYGGSLAAVCTRVLLAPILPTASP